MFSNLSRRASRATQVAAGMAVLCAFATAPMAAQAASDANTLSGTWTAGPLTVTAPTFGSPDTTLTGLTQTVHATVGPWSVTDATGSNNGWSVTVSATAPTVSGTGHTTGTGSTITLTPPTLTANPQNPAPASDDPVAEGAVTLSTTPQTIENASAGTGQGEWNYAGDSGTGSLAVVVPGDASAGAYSSTLTFTTAPAVA